MHGESLSDESAERVIAIISKYVIFSSKSKTSKKKSVMWGLPLLPCPPQCRRLADAIRIKGRQHEMQV